MVRWPRLRRELDANARCARLRAYRFVMVEEWMCVALVLALWVAKGRAWTALWLAPPEGWRLFASLALVLPLGALTAAQFRRNAQSTRSRKRAAIPTARQTALRAKIGAVAEMLPHTRAESRAYAALSVTAGLCEEFLFRGYIVWMFAPWLGLYGAAALSVVLFWLSHLYQGFKPGTRAGLVGLGLMFQLVALGTGSLLPGMALHAIVDLGAGATSYAILRTDEDGDAPTPAH